MKPFVLPRQNKKIDFRRSIYSRRSSYRVFNYRWKTLSVFISEGNPLEESAGAMSGEKLTDEEVLASHKIIPLRGEPR